MFANFDIKFARRARDMVKAISCPWLFIHLLFNKRTVPLGENSSKRNYFIDGKHIVWTIIIPKNYIDFHSWENRTYKRKLLLNLIQRCKNNK